MMGKKSILAALIGCTMAASAGVQATTLKLSHNQDTSTPVHQAMKLLAKRAKALSDGELKIRIYPNAQLGSQRESLELVQNGALDMAKSNAAELEAFAKAYSAFNMPYLFTDRDHYYRALESDLGREILNSSADNGFIGVTYYDAGARSFYSSKPITSPDDLKGMKVRVQPSPTAVSMVKNLGGNPTPLAFGELYTALQQGVVDAAENNIPSMTLNRHSEVVKYFSLDEHTMVPDVLVISTASWNKLSDMEREALTQAAAESMQEMKTIWAEAEVAERQSAEKTGVEFVEVDKAPFQQAVEPMYTELKEKDADLYQLVEGLRKL
ncbi:TRAP transporter substrate-binding protein [Oceanimonas marisflavi]|uniref:TRAP transporter substrate-binding protein n=1 Tax=Oceanimonas marisflavi TaxID=2059724 RepID=UPI000D2FDDDC|nr:TRAP transporter substrate-binding protein [Oceanimonas marisflavi]